MNLTIERSEEALYRNAERLINLRYNIYASLYADVRDKNRFAAMTLLDLALMSGPSAIHRNSRHSCGIYRNGIAIDLYFIVCNRIINRLV
jgi:hypothetical protein